MKILGIGIDIVQNSRIKKAIKNKSFINRIFTKTEILYSKKKYFKTNYFFNKFAAKEALVKSIGTGIGKIINFKDINIINDKSGEPKIEFTKKVSDLIFKKFSTRKVNIYISLSDEKNYSIAFVIIQKK